jgi:hypothetical protein
MTKRRAILVWSLVALATLVTLVSSMTVWTKRQLLNTDNWVQSSSRLLADERVRGLLANRLVNLLYQRVDVTAELQKALPPAVDPAAPAIASGLQTASIRATDAFLATPAAQNIWERANRRAHGTLVDVLEGKNLGRHGRLSTANGALVLDLRPLLKRISDRIGISDRLKAQASPTTGEIVLLKSDQLKSAQRAVKAFRILSVFLVFAILVLYALAIFLAKGKRRVVLGASGATLLGVGLLLLIVRRIAGDIIVDSLVKTQSNKPAVNAVWLIETDLLRDIAIALMLYGLLAMIASFLGGPHRPAVWLRRTLAPAFRGYPVAVYAVAVFALLIVFAWSPIVQGRTLIGTLVLAALILFGLELWRRQSVREFPGDRAEALEPPAAAASKSPV